MVIINDEFLRSFAFRDCEVCGVSDGSVVAHHIWGRGHGGGSRIDHPWTTLALCFKHHSDAQHYRITKRQQIAMIAKREGVTEEQVEDFYHRVLRLPKGSEVPCVTTNPR